MNRYPIAKADNFEDGKWFVCVDEIKPIISCPKCYGWFLGDSAPHSIEENGDVNASVVCPYPPCVPTALRLGEGFLINERFTGCLVFHHQPVKVSSLTVP